MKQIRTLRQAAIEIKTKDPETAVTYNALRMWAQSGTLPTVRAGNVYLVDLAVLEKFLGGELCAANN